MSERALLLLNKAIVKCTKCPRLVAWREEVGVLRRRAYQAETYWAKPVTGFGDPLARLLIVGLAPGAHGANRTGRMFTGDRSGEFLYRALFETGFANQAASLRRDDGLELRDAYITAAARCVPPDNKPSPDELAACRGYLQCELDLLTHLKVVVALGKIAMDSYLITLKSRGVIASRAGFAFGHATTHSTHTGGPLLIGSYHPSQQNTSTGRLTASMLRDIFAQARARLE